jgi:hypothetical protein
VGSPKKVGGMAIGATVGSLLGPLGTAAGALAGRGLIPEGVRPDDPRMSEFLDLERQIKESDLPEAERTRLFAELGIPSGRANFDSVGAVRTRLNSLNESRNQTNRLFEEKSKILMNQPGQAQLLQKGLAKTVLGGVGGGRV